MGRELIERRHRVISPVLLASKYGCSKSLVTFLLLTCLNVVFLVAQMQQEKQVLIYISCHKFSNETTKTWEKVIGRKYFKSTKHSVVCSVHFKRSDFELDYKAQLLGMKNCRRLKKGAIPSLFLRGNSCYHQPYHNSKL